MSYRDGPNPSGLCLCGCGEATPLATQNHARYGWVKDRPMRFLAGHSRRKSAVEYIEQDCGYETPCWVWQRAANQFGYGHTRSGMAHRIFYERHRGPIPDGLHIDHLCRNPPCVNPAHLEAVTNAENARRGDKAKLTHEIVAYIRASSRSSAELAREIGVHYDTVWAARTRRSWV